MAANGGPHRTLKFVLEKLTKAQFVQPCNSSKTSFRFARNGQILRKNLIRTLRFGRIDQIIVKDENEAMKFLKNGQCAIQIPVEDHDDDQQVYPSLKDHQHFLHLWELDKAVDQSSPNSFHTHLRQRRNFWKQYLFHPRQIIGDEIIPKLQNPQTSLQARLEDFIDEDDDEVFLEPIELEFVKLLDDNFMDKKWKLLYSKLDVNAGTMAVLLDSVRKRQFFPSFRAALPSKIAPISLGILVRQPHAVQDLARYVELLLKHEHIEIIHSNDYQTLDDLGVPYTIEIDKNCLTNGVLKLRDRETAWTEQIHLAHLVPRMVNFFQDRKEPNTYQIVKKKYNL